MSEQVPSAMSHSPGAPPRPRTRLRRLLADPAKLTVAIGWGGRIVAALAQFLAIRILTQMLGVDGYGAYAVVTGLLAWFMLADLGLGSSLQNHISERRVAGSRADQAVWSTSVFLAFTTGALGLVLALVSPWVGPFLLDRFHGVSTFDAQLAFFAFGFITCGTAAANIVLKIFFAHHRGYLSHAITVSSAVLGVVILAIIAHYQVSHGLVWAVVGYYLPGLILPTIALVRQLAGSREADIGFWPDRGIIGAFWHSARWFVLFAALGALTLNLDYVILSRTVSANEIVIYSVFSKVYSLVIALFASVLSAYWPVSSEMIRRGNFAGLKRTIVRALTIGAIVSIVVSVGIALFLDLIGRLLSPGAPLALPIVFVPVFTLYCLIRIWSDTFSMVIVAAGRAWVQCIIVPVQAALSLGIGYWGALQYGAVGVLGGMILSYLLTVVWALPLYVKFGIANRSEEFQHD